MLPDGLKSSFIFIKAWNHRSSIRVKEEFSHTFHFQRRVSQLNASTFKTNERCHIYHSYRWTVRVFITRHGLKWYELKHILRQTTPVSHWHLSARWYGVNRNELHELHWSSRSTSEWTSPLTRLDIISTYARTALKHRFRPASWYFPNRTTQTVSRVDFVRDNRLIPKPSLRSPYRFPVKY